MKSTLYFLLPVVLLAAAVQGGPVGSSEHRNDKTNPNQKHQEKKQPVDSAKAHREEKSSKTLKDEIVSAEDDRLLKDEIVGEERNDLLNKEKSFREEEEDGEYERMIESPDDLDDVSDEKVIEEMRDPNLRESQLNDKIINKGTLREEEMDEELDMDARRADTDDFEEARNYDEELSKREEDNEAELLE